jgi:hypothetical protein
MQKVKFKTSVDAGWCRAVAGDERELTEREVGMLLAAHPGCLSVLAAPKVDAVPDETEITERGDDDVPGAPPMDRQHSRRRTVRKRK